MPDRHFYLLRHHILFYINFCCSVCWLQMESRFWFRKKGDCPEIYDFYSPQLWISQKKEKMIYPRCVFGACLRCGRAF